MIFYCYTVILMQAYLDSQTQFPCINSQISVENAGLDDTPNYQLCKMYFSQYQVLSALPWADWNILVNF